MGGRPDPGRLIPVISSSIATKAAVGKCLIKSLLCYKRMNKKKGEMYGIYEQQEPKQKSFMTFYKRRTNDAQVKALLTSMKFSFVTFTILLYSQIAEEKKGSR